MSIVPRIRGKKPGPICPLSIIIGRPKASSVYASANARKAPEKAALAILCPPKSNGSTLQRAGLFQGPLQLGLRVREIVLELRAPKHLFDQVVLLQILPPCRRLDDFLHRVDPPLLHSLVDAGRQHHASRRVHVYVVAQLVKGRNVWQTTHALFSAERESLRIA